MKILFWNTNKNNAINKYIIKLISEEDIDIIFLAEYVDKAEELLKTLRVYPFEEVRQIGCKRIHVFSRYKELEFNRHAETLYYTFISIYNEKIGENILVGAFHLPSKLHSSDENIEVLLYQASMEIKEIKQETRDFMILTGDFNINPFEKPMLKYSIFNTYPHLDANINKKQVIHNTEYDKMFNPMWKFISNRNMPMGTYYYNSTDYHALNWHVFDQFIISPKLMPYFKNVSILSRINRMSLLNNNNTINKEISDHLPILLELHLEGKF